MKFSFDYCLNKQLPKLAWIAQVPQKGGPISVIHGSAVECREEWLVEGIWDGNFEHGLFHRSENFFGSGIRLEGDSVFLVPASARTDRLLYCELDGRIICSNSLMILLAFTAARLDFSHDYYRECYSVLDGVDRYEMKFTIKHPCINSFHQVFYKNIIISADGISHHRRDKPHKIRSFNHYLDVLMDVLSRLRKNYESEARRISISAFTTISAGYDSAAVSAIVKRIGVKTCFTGIPIDSPKYLQLLQPKAVMQAKQCDHGIHVGKALELDVFCLDSRRSSISEDELYFLATNYPKYLWGNWSDLGFHSMVSYIEKNHACAVVFKGHYGDFIWDVDVEDKYLTGQINQKTPFGGGFNLTEIRLKSGFIQVAVPYILSRNIKDVVQISRSRDMEPWRLHNDYDRPIPRRILESAGVDRNLFGMQKGYIATMYSWPVNRNLRKRFSEYLRKEHGITIVIFYIDYLFRLLSQRRIIRGLLLKMGFSFKGREYFALHKDINPGFLMWHWATQELVEKMARILSILANKT
jgi:hypothetical protein